MTADAVPDATDGTRAHQGPIRFFRSLTSALNSLGSFWFFCLIFLIAADILGRALFLHPIKGVIEIVAHSVAAGVFLGLAHALHVGRFTRAETVLEALERRRPYVRSFYEAVYCLFGVAITFGLVYGLTPEFVKAWTKDEIVGVPGWFTFTIWPFRLILLIGAAATMVEFVLLFADHARAFVGGAMAAGV